MKDEDCVETASVTISVRKRKDIYNGSSSKIKF